MKMVPNLKRKKRKRMTKKKQILKPKELKVAMTKRKKKSSTRTVSPS